MKRDHLGRRKWDLASAGQSDPEDDIPVTISNEPAEMKPIEARKDTLDLEDSVGKRVGVVDPKMEGGFSCDKCDELCKDSQSWLAHLNSKKHQMRSGLSMRAVKASTQDVIDHLDNLSQTKKSKSSPSEMKSNSLPEPSKSELSTTQVPEIVDPMALMGFPTSFGTSKKKR